MRFLLSLLSISLFFSSLISATVSHGYNRHQLLTPNNKQIINNQNNNNNNNDYSPTPVGPIRSDCVHTIPSGSRLSRDSKNNLWSLTMIDGIEIKKLIPKCDKKKGSMFLSKKDYNNNNHNNHNNAQDRHHTTLITDSDLPADYKGWTSYTAYNSSLSFDSFLGYFSVPDAPSSTPDILYVFTGLQNIDWIPLADSESSGQGFDIIQPVLQYPADNGEGWSIKSWFVTLDEGAVNSEEKLCQQGDNVFGNMTRINGNNWYISTECSGGLTEIYHSDARLLSQPWAYNTLECYGCDGCSTYPTIPISFTKLLLTQGNKKITPKWIVDPKPSKLKQCHEKSTVVAPDNVVISFQ